MVWKRNTVRGSLVRSHRSYTGSVGKEAITEISTTLDYCSVFPPRFRFEGNVIHRSHTAGVGVETEAETVRKWCDDFCREVLGVFLFLFQPEKTRVRSARLRATVAFGISRPVLMCSVHYVIILKMYLVLLASK